MRPADRMTMRISCLWLILIVLLMLSATSGCAANPLAPSTPQSTASIDISSYLIPMKMPVRTGAHPQSLWWDGMTLTNVKGHDSSQVEQWRLEGDMWRHVFDRTDGTGTAYRLLPGDWLPAVWSEGSELRCQQAELVRVDMSGRFVERVPFPYTVRLEHVYEVLEIGGDIGTAQAIEVSYQPLQVNGRPHAHPNKEYFRFARYYGLVGWKADWDSRDWLVFNERYSIPVSPGFMVELPSH